MKTHYVKKNETLDGIAKINGLPNGEFIFYAQCNYRLRQFRSKPSAIQPGDQIHIPDNAVDATKKKLDNLKKLRADYVKMNDDILNEWASEHRKVTGVANNVDTAKKVIDIFMGVSKIIKGGFEAMKLSGELLDEANKKLAKSTLEYAYSPVVDVAKDWAGGTILKEKAGDGLYTAIGKDVLHFFLIDWNTPSYWTSKITGVDINKIDTEVKTQIQSQKNSTLKKLDEQIAKTEMQLLKLKRIEKGHSHSLY